MLCILVGCVGQDVLLLGQDYERRRREEAMKNGCDAGTGS